MSCKGRKRFHIEMGVAYMISVILETRTKRVTKASDDCLRKCMKMYENGKTHVIKAIMP